MNKVIKGRKYILAGNFPAEHKQTFIDNLTKELKIEIVAVITSDNTHFIEYGEDNSEDLCRTIERQRIDIERLKRNQKRGWF